MKLEEIIIKFQSDFERITREIEANRKTLKQLEEQLENKGRKYELLKKKIKEAYRKAMLDVLGELRSKIYFFESLGISPEKLNENLAKKIVLYLAGEVYSVNSKVEMLMEKGFKKVLTKYIQPILELKSEIKGIEDEIKKLNKEYKNLVRYCEGLEIRRKVIREKIRVINLLKETHPSKVAEEISKKLNVYYQFEKTKTLSNVRVISALIASIPPLEVYLEVYYLKSDEVEIVIGILPGGTGGCEILYNNDPKKVIKTVVISDVKKKDVYPRSYIIGTNWIDENVLRSAAESIVKKMRITSSRCASYIINAIIRGLKYSEPIEISCRNLIETIFASKFSENKEYELLCRKFEEKLKRLAAKYIIMKAAEGDEIIKAWIKHHDWYEDPNQLLEEMKKIAGVDVKVETKTNIYSILLER